MTKEARDALVKQVGKITENAKQAVRHARQEGMQKLKSAKSSVSEDDIRRAEKDLQNEHDKIVKRIVELADRKSKELVS